MTWRQTQKLTASDGAAHYGFGVSVALSRNTLLVGSPGGKRNAGAVYVFVRNGAGFGRQAILTASDGAAGDRFGASVALKGDTALVGADHDSKRDAGAAYVFVRKGRTWSETQKLTASDGDERDGFGGDVALSGNTAVVGASLTDLRGKDTVGAAYVFTRSGDTSSK